MEENREEEHHDKPKDKEEVKPQGREVYSSREENEDIRDENGQRNVDLNRDTKN